MPLYDVTVHFNTEAQDEDTATAKALKEFDQDDILFERVIVSNVEQLDATGIDGTDHD